MLYIVVPIYLHHSIPPCSQVKSPGSSHFDSDYKYLWLVQDTIGHDFSSYFIWMVVCIGA